MRNFLILTLRYRQTPISLNKESPHQASIYFYRQANLKFDDFESYLVVVNTFLYVFVNNLFTSIY